MVIFRFIFRVREKDKFVAVIPEDHSTAGGGIDSGKQAFGPEFTSGINPQYFPIGGKLNMSVSRNHNGWFFQVEFIGLESIEAGIGFQICTWMQRNKWCCGEIFRRCSERKQQPGCQRNDSFHVCLLMSILINKKQTSDVGQHSTCSFSRLQTLFSSHVPHVHQQKEY